MEKLSNLSLKDFAFNINDFEMIKRITVIERQTIEQIIVDEINEGLNFLNTKEDCEFKIYDLYRLAENYCQYFDREMTMLYGKMFSILKEKHMILSK
jgi:hypothetical protein